MIVNKMLMMLVEFMENCIIWYCLNMIVNFFFLVNEIMIMVWRMVELFFVDILKLSFEGLIVMFGVVGNLLVVIFIIGFGKKKLLIDFFLLNLVIVDFGILLLLFLFIVIREKVF